MTQHTPGPWKVTAGTEVRTDDGSGIWRSVAMLNVRLDEWTANAHLIAAAPDLLAACESMRRAEHLWGVDRRAFEEAFEEAMRAICKAVAKVEAQP